MTGPRPEAGRVSAAVAEGARAAAEAAPVTTGQSIPGQAIPELRLRLPRGATPREVAEATRAALAAALRTGR